MTSVPDGPDHAAASTRSRLLGIKLTALVGDHLGRPVSGEAVTFPAGAALRESNAAWVLLDESPGRRLGAAVAWGLRHGAAEIHVVAESEAGIVARRAAELALPTSVWAVEGRSLVAVPADPPLVPAEPAGSHLALRGLITEGGAEVLVEHGVVLGEVRGLEVCRVVDDPDRDPAGDGVRLEVGVGIHDREAFQMIHGNVPTVDALAGVVAAVERHRAPGAAPHPLNRLAIERYLRWRLVDDPGLVGAATVVPLDPPVPRTSLKDVVACSALATTSAGERVLVVCSAGVDLDVVPYALDARRAATWTDAPGVAGRIRTIVVLPTRDLVPLTRDLAALADPPLELMTLD